MTEVIEIVKVLGPCAGLAVAFLWVILKKHGELEKRLDDTNRFIQTDLMRSAQHSAEVIAQNTVALESMGDHCGCPFKGETAAKAVRAVERVLQG